MVADIEFSNLPAQAQTVISEALGANRPSSPERHMIF